jgi:hypothetical protein
LNKGQLLLTKIFLSIVELKILSVVAPKLHFGQLKNANNVLENKLTHKSFGDAKITPKIMDRKCEECQLVNRHHVLQIPTEFNTFNRILERNKFRLLLYSCFRHMLHQTSAILIVRDVSKHIADLQAKEDYNEANPKKRIKIDF